MGYPRPRPKHLAAKLQRIRLHLKLSQAALARQLGINNYNDVWKWERNVYEPNLMVLLAYARLADIPVETLIDDNQDLGEKINN